MVLSVGSIDRELLNNFLQQFFLQIILPFIIIVLIIMAIIIIIEAIKYKGKNLPSFRHKDITNCRDQMLDLTLDQISWYKKIIKPEYLNSNYVMIDGNGISLFALILGSGTITGNAHDKELSLKEGTQVTMIPNLIRSLKKDENRIHTIIPDVIINEYLVIIEGINVSVKTDIDIVKFNQLLYVLHDGNKYTKNDINNYAKILVKAGKPDKQNMSNSVN